MSYSSKIKRFLGPEKYDMFSNYQINFSNKANSLFESLAQPSLMSEEEYLQLREEARRQFGLDDQGLNQNIQNYIEQSNATPNKTIVKTSIARSLAQAIDERIEPQSIQNNIPIMAQLSSKPSKKKKKKKQTLGNADEYTTLNNNPVPDSRYREEIIKYFENNQHRQDDTDFLNAKYKPDLIKPWEKLGEGLSGYLSSNPFAPGERDDPDHERHIEELDQQPTERVQRLSSSTKQKSRRSALNPSECKLGILNRVKKRSSCANFTDAQLQKLITEARNTRVPVNIRGLGHLTKKAFPDQALKKKLSCTRSIMSYIRSTRACGGAPYARFESVKDYNENDKINLTKIKRQTALNRYNNLLNKQKIKFYKNGLKNIAYIAKSDKMDQLFSHIDKIPNFTKSNIDETINKWNNFWNNSNIQRIRDITQNIAFEVPLDDIRDRMLFDEYKNDENV